MTAKEYLNQARHLEALINCRLREIDYWRDLSSSAWQCSMHKIINSTKAELHSKTVPLLLLYVILQPV